MCLFMYVRYVCMCLFMYVRYVCMYVCMYVCLYVCMYVCMYACMHVCIYVYMHVSKYLCMHVLLNVIMHACTYVCIAASVTGEAKKQQGKTVAKRKGRYYRGLRMGWLLAQEKIQKKSITSCYRPSAERALRRLSPIKDHLELLALFLYLL
jgi:hypothetical protein